MLAAPGQGVGADRLQIAGQRLSGQDVRTQNVTAVSAIANIVKSSLGPVGLDKVGTLIKFLERWGIDPSLLA